MLVFQAKCIKHMEAFTQRFISRWSVTLYARYSDTPQKKSKLAPLQVDPQLFSATRLMHKKGQIVIYLKFLSWARHWGFGYLFIGEKNDGPV